MFFPGVRYFLWLCLSDDPRAEELFHQACLVMLGLVVLTVLFILFLKYRQRKSDEVAKEIMANCKRTEDYIDRFDSIIE